MKLLKMDTFFRMETSRLNTYISDIKNITNHRDALKHFQVRYSSFNQNYPKDATLPTCVLAENGFYFDEKNRVGCLLAIIAVDFSIAVSIYVEWM
jgi:hypothetical protein